MLWSLSHLHQKNECRPPDDKTKHKPQGHLQPRLAALREKDILKRKTEEQRGPIKHPHRSCSMLFTHQIYVGARVYLCVKLPWLVHGAIAGGESRVAAAVRNRESSCVVKPGGFQPVPVVMDATTLPLSGIERQSTTSLSVKIQYGKSSKIDLQ